MNGDGNLLRRRRGLHYSAQAFDDVTHECVQALRIEAAHQRPGGLAVLDQNDMWKRPDSKGRPMLLQPFQHLDACPRLRFDDLDLAGLVQVGEQRLNELARAAPVLEEVEDDWAVGVAENLVLEVLIRDRGELDCCGRRRAVFRYLRLLQHESVCEGRSRGGEVACRERNIYMPCGREDKAVGGVRQQSGEEETHDPVLVEDWQQAAWKIGSSHSKGA